MEPLSARGLPRLSWIDTLYSSMYPPLSTTTITTTTTTTQLILMLLSTLGAPCSAVFLPSNPPPGLVGFLFAFQPQLHTSHSSCIFFPLLFLRTSNWMASLLLSVTLREAPHQPSGGIHPGLLLLLIVFFFFFLI